MSLSTKYKQELKAKAHKLKPIVFIGRQGLTESVVNEIDRGLQDHELIKIRIQVNDREMREALFNEACVAAHAEAIQFIGGIGVIYKKRTDLAK